MKNISLSGILFILALMIFQSQVSFAQINIMGLYNSGTVENCNISPDVEISENLCSGDDTVLVFRNTKGYITIDNTSKMYRFCGENDNVQCDFTMGNVESGEFQMLFKINGSEAGINYLKFTIHTVLGLSPAVTSYRGTTGQVETGTLVTEGIQYTIEETTASITKVVVECPADSRYDRNNINFYIDELKLQEFFTAGSTAGPASATPTLCINTTLTPVTHTTAGATGIGAATGLPPGVSAAWASNTITISGTPSAAGTYSYSIPLTGGCGSANATGTISVTANNTVSPASATPALCINTALTPVTHTTTGATGIGSATGLPPGVSAAWASNTITISGTPSATGTYSYSIPLTGGCGSTNATGTISVTANTTVSPASATPALCINTALTPVTHTTTGATGIGAATGLPPGVSAAWASNTITISGTPSATGTYSYSIPLTGGCGSVNATGTINVTANNTVSAASSTPTVCISTALSPVTHTTTGATGIGTATGLPTGVGATWASNTITISGTPSAAGTYSYSIPLAGGCGSVSATGTITVTANNTVTPASPTTICINTALIPITHTTTGATGIGAASGLPPGVNAAWASSTITISGTPSSGGTYNYTVPLTGGCGSVSASGTIIVNETSEVICLVDLSASMSRDFYEHSTSNPFAVKLYHAKNALTQFVNLLDVNHQCQYLGIARFPNSPQVGCDAGTIINSDHLDSGFKDNIINNIIPVFDANGSSTPMLAGINQAISMFSTSGKRTIVLLTDGLQNCPAADLTAASAINTNLQNSGIKLYTVSFGDFAMIPDNLIETLVSNSVGKTYNVQTSPKVVPPYDPASPGPWDAGPALSSVFGSIIEELYGMTSSTDPLEVLKPGETKQVEIPVSMFDERICIFVSWVNPHENNPLISLLTPSGAELSLNQPGIKTINNPTHTIIALYDTFLKRKGAQGSYKLKINGTRLPGTEHYQYTVLHASAKIDLKSWFDKSKYFTGDKMRIFAQFSVEGKNLRQIENIAITGTKPSISPGNWLTSKNLNESILEKKKQKMLEEYLKLTSKNFEQKGIKAESAFLNSEKEAFLKNIHPLELRLSALREEYDLQTPGLLSIDGLSFSDNGRNGDEKAGDGIYTAIYIPDKEGIYCFNISCSDKRNGLITRENRVSTYVDSKVLEKPDIKSVKLIEKATNGQYIYDVRYELMDKFGNKPGPGITEKIEPLINHGSVIGKIKDNLDGTYTTRVSLPGAKEAGRLSLKVNQQGISKPRSTPRSGRKFLLPVTAALILTGGITLVTRKKKT